MGTKEIRIKLSEKYALTDKEIKKATKEAAKMGKLPELDKVRELEKIPDDAGEFIKKALSGTYPKTAFDSIGFELNEMVIAYTGKKPRGIEKQKFLKPYI
jgi:hypothetical protein